MLKYVLAALGFMASAAAGAETLTFGEWFVENDGKSCLMSYEDTDRMLEIVAGKGGLARFATDPSTVGDTLGPFKGELFLAGKSQGFRDGQSQILSAQIGAGYVMKFEPQLLTANDLKGVGEIRRGGKTIFRFPLEGAQAAAKALLACQAKITTGG